jgi:hypothetical protein
MAGLEAPRQRSVEPEPVQKNDHIRALTHLDAGVPIDQGQAGSRSQGLGIAVSHPPFNRLAGTSIQERDGAARRSVLSVDLAQLDANDSRGSLT